MWPVLTRGQFLCCTKSMYQVQKAPIPSLHQSKIPPGENRTLQDFIQKQKSHFIPTQRVKDHLPSFLNTVENKIFSPVVLLLILVLQLHKIPLHSYIHFLQFTLSCLWQGSFHCNSVVFFKTPTLKCNNLVASDDVGKKGGCTFMLSYNLEVLVMFLNQQYRFVCFLFLINITNFS